MQRRQIANRIWAWLGADARVVQIVVALLVTYLLILFLPQSPVAANDSPAFSRWLAELRPVLGPWRKTLATIGLLNLRTSLWMRGWVAFLAVVITVRLSMLGEHWGSWTRRHRWGYSLLCLGGVLFVLGWGAQTLWAWSEPDLVAWPDEPLRIPERNLTLPAMKGRLRFWNGAYGLYLLPQGTSFGLEVQAFDPDEQPLPLLTSLYSEPEDRLRISLTPQAPEAYFTLVEQNLIFRVNASQAWDEGGIQLQVYRSASGELLAELMLAHNQHVDLQDVRLEFAHFVLPRLAAVYNPGALLQGLGVLLFVIGYGLYWRWHGNNAHENSSQPALEEHPD